MAIHTECKVINGMHFHRCKFSITAFGTWYPIAVIPPEVIELMDFEQEMEYLFLFMHYGLFEEKRRVERERARLQALEMRERIIGFARTMSRILHRKMEEAAKKQKKTVGPSS
ncbi:hypothetical protein POM88_022975 [Heracleum sosnowskyi]|uniref:Uncharacterized protein n=1 Tax=Heracleum sosnowskyi TaxID=360622 RepID=A0AAD8IJT1_9APIA|nr:hypothetical protein POM88_054423 [Heracleum sosnowskyi]KAK1385240.1 hypothetical protein POM88_022975 [Heracleum sosnowskyi]